jgi:hypothetical protein
MRIVKPATKKPNDVMRPLIEGAHWPIKHTAESLAPLVEPDAAWVNLGAVISSNQMSGRISRAIAELARAINEYIEQSTPGEYKVRFAECEELASSTACTRLFRAVTKWLQTQEAGEW